MHDTQLPKAWNELSEKLSFMPAVVKAIEKIHDTSWSMDLSRHDHYEMVYIKKGTATFMIDGIDVNMAANSLVIIKPQKSHKFIVRSENCELIVLYFHLQAQKEGASSHASLKDFVEYIEDESVGSYIYLKLGKKNDIINVIKRILRERMKPQVWGDFLSCILVMELFILLSRTLKQEWEQSVKNRNLKLHELLNVAKEYIDQNYAKDLTLSQVAKYIYLSDSYFAHSFKDKFGISPKSYILKIRIEEAKDLLENTDMKIADVARSVGFSSQQRFNDIFRKYTAVTPLKFRQAKRKEKINKVQ